MQHAIHNADAPARTAGDVFVVGDDGEGEPLRRQVAEDVEDAVGVLRVEVAGGLVGENSARSVSDTRSNAAMARSRRPLRDLPM